MIMWNLRLRLEHDEWIYEEWEEIKGESVS